MQARCPWLGVRRQRLSPRRSRAGCCLSRASAAGTEALQMTCRLALRSASAGVSGMSRHPSAGILTGAGLAGRPDACGRFDCGVPAGVPGTRQPGSFAPETTTVLIRRREDPARVRAGDCSPVNRAVPSVRCGPPHSGRAAASNASGEAFSTAPALRNVVAPCGTLTGNSRRICPLSLSGISTRSMGSRRWPRGKTCRRLVHSSPSPSRDGRHLK